MIACGDDQIQIQKIWANPPGIDDAEFLEISGPPNSTLSGLSLLVVESDQGKSYAKIDRRIDFSAIHKIGKNGFFLIGNCNGLPQRFSVQPDKHIDDNFFENSSITIALVKTSDIQGGKMSGHEALISSVAILKKNAKSPHSQAKIIPSSGGNVAGGAYIGGRWQVTRKFASSLRPQSAGRNACDVSYQNIQSIQGNGQISPLKGEMILTRGVVSYIRGKQVWIQDEHSNSEASSGIKVINHDKQALQLGDEVEIKARVEEKAYGRGLSVTQLNPLESIKVLQRGRTLPKTNRIERLQFATVSMAIDYWERREGMRVFIKAARVVGPSDKYGNAVVIVKNDKIEEDLSDGNKVLHLASVNNAIVHYNPQRVFLLLPQSNSLQLGQELGDITGVVDYTFGHYKILVEQLNISPRVEWKLPDQAKELSKNSIASFNLENLFDDEDTPNKRDERNFLSEKILTEKISRLAHVIRDNLALPAIIAVQEVENQALLQRLAKTINIISGKQYSARSIDSSDLRGIEQGIIWDRERANLQEVELARGVGIQKVFTDKKSREPLMARLTLGKHDLRLLVVHLKSKGGDDPVFGVHQPPRRNSEKLRLQQAKAIAEYLHQTKNDSAKWIILGDFNDFVYLEPGEEITALGVIGQFPRLRYSPGLDFSYIFNGNAQLLDHFITDRSLQKNILGLQAIHCNTPKPHHLRVSDHDPIILYLD